MFIELAIVAIILAAYTFRTPIKQQYTVWQLKKDINQRQLEIVDLIEKLKSRETQVELCRKTPSSCPNMTEQQLTMASAGIGSHQSDIVHIRNDLTDLYRDVDKIFISASSNDLRETLIQQNKEKLDGLVKQLEAIKAVV